MVVHKGITQVQESLWKLQGVTRQKSKRVGRVELIYLDNLLKLHPVIIIFEVNIHQQV